MATFLFTATEVNRSFGIEGKITFEDGSAKGTRVILTVGNKELQTENLNKDLSYHEQYLLASGNFYRAITHTSGETLNIWIQREGYPLIQIEQVLNYNKTNINIGEVYIPTKVRKDQISPVTLYETPCDKSQSVASVSPQIVRLLKNFRSTRCEPHSPLTYSAQVKLDKQSIQSSPEPQTIQLASVTRFSSSLYFSQE